MNLSQDIHSSVDVHITVVGTSSDSAGSARSNTTLV